MHSFLRFKDFSAFIWDFMIFSCQIRFWESKWQPLGLTIVNQNKICYLWLIWLLILIEDLYLNGKWCSGVWWGLKNGYQEDTCPNNCITMVSSIVNMVVFVCVREGDDHIMSTKDFLFDSNIFVHVSSKFMRKADATSMLTQFSNRHLI